MQKERDINEALRLKPGQQELSPEQKAEATRFAAERIRAQLSTEPVNEQEAEDWLRQAYQVAHLAPPRRVIWLDGPLQLVWLVLPQDAVQANDWNSIEPIVEDSVWNSIWPAVEISVEASVRDAVRGAVGNAARGAVGNAVRGAVGNAVGVPVWGSFEGFLRDPVGGALLDAAEASVRGYNAAIPFASYRFFDAYLAPNDLHALARFNEMVSGYWLGQEEAFIVRKPRLLALDSAGRLHSETGKCVEYRDGWGFYAWHGVRVQEKVILAPEQLNRGDFVTERNLEARRVIQERMGTRFVSALGGKLIDEGPRGRLYEMMAPADEPDPVARYVQVQDASTPRQYFLRVPPTIQTAAEAVAWTFSMSLEDYQPTKET